MIELISAEQLSKATERAKAGNLFVRPSSIFRQYHVTNRDTGAKYTVDFFVRKSDGKRFGNCTCKAGQNNKACKHLSAAAGYHIVRMAAKREAERIASMPKAA
jgi:SWIM zinc finger